MESNKEKNMTYVTQKWILNLCPEIFKSQKVKGDYPSGKLGRANASLLFSILNMGQNVATRAEVQNPHFKGGSFKETGIDVIGSYSRSERNHPGYKLVRDILEDAREGYREFYKLDKKQTEVIDIDKVNDDQLDKIKDLSKNKDKLKPEEWNEQWTSAQEKRLSSLKNFEDPYRNYGLLHEAEIETPSFVSKTWLGQYFTPEERLEVIFSKLSEKDVLRICEFVVKKNLDKKNVSDDLEGFSSGLKALQGKSTEIQTKPEKKTVGKGFHFKQIMEYRLKLTQAAAASVKSNDLITISAPETDYPCVIFDLRGLIKYLDGQSQGGAKGTKGQAFKEEFKIADLEMSSNSVGYLNNLLLSYFCGLINKWSASTFGEEYIEMQPQGSFGSIRTSITDTGYSFRVSLGLVPKVYVDIFEEAGKKFQAEIEKNKDELAALLKADFDKCYDEKEGDYNQKASKLKTLENNKTRIELANATTSGEEINSIIAYCKNKIKQGKIKFASKKNNHWLKGGNQKALPPKEFTNSMASVIEAYDQLKKSYHVESSTAIKCIEQVIEQIIERYHSDKAPDYSKVACYFETLLRLLQIRQEIATVEKYKAPKYLPELQKGVSTDSTMSNEGDIQEGVNKNRPSRSGMSALTQSIMILSEAFKDKKPTFGLEEIYFEIGQDYTKSVKEYYSREHNFEIAGDQYGILKEDEKCDIRLIDIAPFPRYEAGESKPSRWLTTKKWSDMKNLPKVLLVDVTSATEKDFLSLLKKFNNQREDSSQSKVPAMMVFASNNKYGQAGVDLSCMGELRLCTLKEESLESEDQKLVESLWEAFEEATKERTETTVSMKAYRQVLQAAGLLRTSQACT